MSGLLTPKVCLSVDFICSENATNSCKGKHRAFIQFEDVDHAAAFINENFPKVRITLPHTTDDAPDGKISAYIHFAHRRDDTEARVSGGGQWVCQPVRLLRLSMLH